MYCKLHERADMETLDYLCLQYGHGLFFYRHPDKIAVVALASVEGMFKLIRHCSSSIAAMRETNIICLGCSGQISLLLPLGGAV